MTTASNYALRLQRSLFEEVKRLAAEQNTTINQFINVAVAEKTAALRTEAWFRERAGRADLDAFDRILARGGGEPPRPGDELPDPADSDAPQGDGR